MTSHISPQENIHLLIFPTNCCREQFCLLLLPRAVLPHKVAWLFFQWMKGKREEHNEIKAPVYISMWHQHLQRLILNLENTSFPLLVRQKQITLHTGDAKSNGCHFLQRTERFEPLISLLIVRIRLLILIGVAVLSPLSHPPCLCLPDPRIPSCVSHVSHCLLVYAVLLNGSTDTPRFRTSGSIIGISPWKLWGLLFRTKLSVSAQHAWKSIHTSCGLIMFENNFFGSAAHLGSSRLSVYITATLSEQNWRA